MNHLTRNQSSRSRRGTGAPVALAAGSGTVAGAPAALAARSSSIAGAHSGLAAASSPAPASVQLAGFPAWWTSPSPMASPTEGLLLGCVTQRTRWMELIVSQINIGQMLLKNTTKAQRLPARDTGTN